MKLDITPEAKGDIRDIYAYSKIHWGAVRARDYLDDLRNRMKALALGDLTGAMAEDIIPGLRRQIVGSHVIWFRMVGDRLRVIRVLHQSRDAGRWLG